MSNSGTDQVGPIVFHSLVVERFRGFNTAQEIPLDASAVVISGANGQGKTSLFDAIQWLVVGRIRRLEEFRLRKNEEHIVNTYALPGSKARVEARIKDISSGKWVTVTRTGNHRGSILEVTINGEVIFGNEATTWLKRALGAFILEDDVFERDFLSAALLEQDLVRSFLSTSTPADRYEILSRLLGLSTIDEFIDELAASEKYINEQVKEATYDLKQAQEALVKVEHDLRESSVRIETAPVLAETVKDLEHRATALGLGFLLERQLDSPDLRTQLILRDTRQYRERLRRLDELTDILHSHFGKRPKIALEKLQEDASNIEKQLDAEKSQLKADQAVERESLEALDKIHVQTDNLRQLANTAIPLLTDRCPVCSQKIDPDHVRTQLESLLADQPALLQARRSHDQASKVVAARSKTISQLEVTYNDALTEIKAAESWQVHAKSLIDELRETGKGLENLGFPQPIPQIALIVEWLPSLKEWSFDCSARLKEVEELAEKAVAAQSVSEESGRLKRLKKELSHRQQQRDEKQSVLERVTHDLAARRKLTEVAREKATEVVAEAFAELDPVVQDLFCRLAPHPTFTQLSFSHEVYYKRGTSNPLAIDQQAKRRVSPAIGFSSAQANVAALCYFLALAFASSEADFGFVLLDDPLQSMDDVNILGFSDLCRFLRKEKQLVIATHEDRLCNLLVRKLTSRDMPMQTLRLNFSSWSRSGPYIEVERIGMQPEVAVLSGLD